MTRMVSTQAELLTTRSKPLTPWPISSTPIMSAPIATQPGQAAPRPLSQAQGGSRRGVHPMILYF